MNVLLDTYVLLWYYLDDPQLSGTARAVIQDPANPIFISAASHWEIAIKFRLKKYELSEPLDVLVNRELVNNDIPFYGSAHSTLRQCQQFRFITKTRSTE